MIYDFKNGLTADYILRRLQAKYAKESDFLFERFEGIPHEDIFKKGDSFIYRKGEHEYYMFAYKNRYATVGYDALPKYHITFCVTRETYSGYRFSNQMPVEIYCADQRKDLGKKNLELCKNCHEELSYFIYGDEETEWFDAILKKAGTREYTDVDLRRDGYTRDWNQVSKALRYKRGFKCETCEINLSARNAQWFCEVHHIDKDKTNNTRSNLRCACIECHANVDNVHRSNYSKGRNEIKLNHFRTLFRD